MQAFSFCANNLMIQTSIAIICLAYILGLLLAALPWGGFWVVILGILGAVFSRRQRIKVPKTSQKKDNHQGKTKTIPQVWKNNPKPIIWLVAGVIGLLASLYLQWRVPQPEVNDISKLVPPGSSNNQEQLVSVRGEVTSTPRLTRSQRGQFWLEATQLDDIKNDNGPAGVPKGVTGKVYVTVPILQATGLYPGQQIAVTGILYKPKSASNPGAFDFQKYLRQEGAFVGLAGRQTNIIDKERKWGWWVIRERIVRSQVRWLGVPEGPLISAMVLGSKAVDLPYDIRDLFVKAGLAHALAASGFQVSLILGVVLGLTKRAKRRTQFILGGTALILFLALTGLQASVLRAVVMGFAALIGLLLKRRVKQLGSLLLAATLLLLFNPLWIEDLGFQLSFLATLGLVVTATPITKRLSWLPPALASLISVPLAATIWTLPLQLQVFGVVPAYSFPLNIITTPLISVISIGGVISAILGLILPEAGSAVAVVLHYPTDWFIKLVEFFSGLPGNSVTLGSISTWQTVAIYMLILSAWLVPWWQRRWTLAGILALTLVLIPAWHSASSLFRITVLASGEEPVLVIQDKGTITLINSGDEGTGRFTILPFLLQQGANKIDWAIASDFQGNGSNGWMELLQGLPIKNFSDYSVKPGNSSQSQLIQKEVQKYQGTYQPLTVGQVVNTGSTVANLINDQLPILQLQIQGQNWLLVGNLKSKQVQQLANSSGLPPTQVLWCSGQSLKDLVSALKPQVAIAFSANLNTETLTVLNQSNTKLFLTGRDGAIQWTPDGKFEGYIQTTENKTSVL
jgi:competence protein ComEC